MNYRQWKKRYKKLHGVNPPLELDKRRQRRLARKAVKSISSFDFSAVATRLKRAAGRSRNADRLHKKTVKQQRRFL